MAEPAETPEIFTCFVCNGTFETAPGWTEEDARAELEQLFPGVSTEECERVCDGCDALMRQALKDRFGDLPPGELLNAVRRDILRLLGFSPN